MLVVVFIITLLLGVYIMAIAPIKNDKEYREENAKNGGTVVLVGVSLANIEYPSILNVMHELNVKGAIGYTVFEFNDCIELMTKKKIDTLKFVDDIVSLERVQESFERLTSGEDGAIKILIDPKK